MPAVVGAGVMAAAPAHAGAMSTGVSGSVSAAAGIQAKAATSTTVSWVRYGDVGALVKVVQQRLRTVAVDGSFGPKTLAAVKAYQKAHGLYVDGAVGPATWAKLGGYPTSTGSTGGGSTGGGSTGGGSTGGGSTGGGSGAACTVGSTLRYGASGSTVRTLQSELGGIAVDGSFGPKTLAAVKAFQRAKQLPVTGAADAATWKALGCTPAAGGGGGTSAPTPPASGGDPNAAYRLPWAAGVTYEVTQGPGGAVSHHTVWNSHAIDVSMPVGTTVLAARGGVVQDTGVVASGGRYVRIKDASGLCQVYFHLSASTVQAGQVVPQGAPIARSGNSGHSSGPHLHFDLLTCSDWHSAATMDTVEEGTSYYYGEEATSQNG